MWRLERPVALSSPSSINQAVSHNENLTTQHLWRTRNTRFLSVILLNQLPQAVDRINQAFSHNENQTTHHKLVLPSEVSAVFALADEESV
jgi:hypothetical protein